MCMGMHALPIHQLWLTPFLAPHLPFPAEAIASNERPLH
jgi:hypothetical protein